MRVSASSLAARQDLAAAVCRGSSSSGTLVPSPVPAQRTCPHSKHAPCTPSCPTAWSCTHGPACHWLTHPTDDEEGEAGTGKGGKQSKPEKKSRKAMQKLGMKPVPGVARVTIKKSKNVSSSSSGRAFGAGGTSSSRDVHAAPGSAGTRTQISRLAPL